MQRWQICTNWSYFSTWLLSSQVPTPMLSHLKSNCLLCYAQKGTRSRSRDKLRHYMAMSKVLFEMWFCYNILCSLHAIYRRWIRLYSGQWGGSYEQHLQQKNSLWILNMIWCKLVVKWCNAVLSITLNNKYKTNMILSTSKKSESTYIYAQAPTQKSQRWCILYEIIKAVGHVS